MNSQSEAAIVLQAQQLGKRFAEGALDVTVLQGLDLQLRAGERLAITGTSGSGKSTLLHLLAGLEAPSTGSVSLMGRAWAQMTPSEQGRWRARQLGFVYQFHHLLPELTALENIALPLRIARQSAAIAHARAHELLRQVDLSARAAHRPAQLSGGERQRVAIARALAARPACILADEPTGNLDRETAQRVFALLTQICAAEGAALLLVSHDERLAAACSRRLVLEGGRLR